MRTTRLRVALVAAALTALGVGIATTPVAAATITVDTTTDVVNGGDGVTSLREAFTAASLSAAADVVVLTAATYELTDCVAGELSDTGTGDLTVDGNGATIDQTCDDTRLMSKTQVSGTLALDGVTLTASGINTGVGVAGAAVLTVGRVVLDHATVTGIDNTTFGTVIEFTSTAAPFDVEVLDSTISANGGRAVDNSTIGGDVHVVDSTISDNTGGGIDLVDGTPVVVEGSTVTGNGGYGIKTTGQGDASLSVTDSTVSGNVTGMFCGACGTVAVIDSTVSDNGVGAGAGTGGGIWSTTDQDSLSDAPTISISGSTITGNEAQRDGGGISINGIEAHTATAQAEIEIVDSIVDDNHADCAGCDGGGISVRIGSLSVSATHIGDNTAAGDGGGIRHMRDAGDELTAPTLFSLTDSTVVGNTAGGDGGGVYSRSSGGSVTRSTIAGNSAGVAGGGLALGAFMALTDPAEIAVDDTTVSGNDAVDGGGLMLLGGALVDLTNSTVHGNSATGDGGGLATSVLSSLDLDHATVTANSAAAGANLAADGSVGTARSIVSQPAGGATNCATYITVVLNITSTGNSWFDDNSCEPGATDTVDPGGDPELGALANNGGPTQTRLPAATSPVGGLVPLVSCTLTVDQRALPRPAGTGCEAGSVEIVEAPAGPEPITGTPRADVLVGTPGPDLIDGLAGHDILSGLAGDDTLQGGPGSDLLIGGPGNDTLLGGPGNDILLASAGDTLDGGPGLDLCVVPNRLPRLC